MNSSFITSRPVFGGKKNIFAILCQYLPLEPYLPCREIPVNSTGKYRGWNFPPNLDWEPTKKNMASHESRDPEETICEI